MRNDFAVYMHAFPNGKKYVGITCQKPEYRWRNGKKYNGNPYLSNAINKYGWNNIEHLILFNNLTKEEAEQKEIELIAYYKSNQRKYGYNIQNGGNHSGKQSEETILKMKKSLKGRKSPCGMLGKKHSEKTKHQMSLTRKGIKQSKEIIEKRMKKLRIKVNQYDTNDNLIKTWDSITFAANELKIKDSDISRVCKGKRNYCGGYKWRYVDEI